MAKKLRTGFELPFSNATGSDQSKTFTNDSDYLFKGVINGLVSKGNTTRSNNLSSISVSDSINIYQKTTARTKSNGTRGCVHMSNGSMLSVDATKFTSGFYANYWFYHGSGWNNNAHYLTLLAFDDGTDSWYINWNYNSGSPTLEVYKHGTGSVASVSVTGSTNNTYYNLIAQIDSSGNIDVSWNGTSVTYATGVSYSNVTHIAICHTSVIHSTAVDDLSLNDGSTANDNSVPVSIKGYNFFDAATLNTNSGFAQVGGSGILANLQDGDDDTRVSASADLSYLDFSLPTLSATGMAETASNFTKIEAINVYARQIEATKASSVLKAKITDATSSANREEDISLPLTVGNDSAVMFDDGASDWSLANLDAGNMDLKITFDKP